MKKKRGRPKDDPKKYPRLAYPDILAHPKAVENLWVAVIKEAVFDLPDKEASEFLNGEGLEQVCEMLNISANLVRGYAERAARSIAAGKLNRKTVIKKFKAEDNPDIGFLAEEILGEFQINLPKRKRQRGLDYESA